jgi:hypothetical protein
MEEVGNGWEGADLVEDSDGLGLGCVEKEVSRAVE